MQRAAIFQFREQSALQGSQTYSIIHGDIDDFIPSSGKQPVRRIESCFVANPESSAMDVHQNGCQLTTWHLALLE